MKDLNLNEYAEFLLRKSMALTRMQDPPPYLKSHRESVLR
jgi:hypothetical protein